VLGASATAPLAQAETRPAFPPAPIAAATIARGEPQARPTAPPLAVRVAPRIASRQEPASEPEAARQPAQPGRPTPVEAQPGGDSLPAVERLKAAWPAIVESVGRADKKVQALLRDCSGPERVDDRVVFLGFQHGFHRDQIDQEKNRTLVEAAIAEVVGQPCQVRCELVARLSKPQPAQGLAIDDPLVREALSQGGRIKGVINTSAKESANDAE
jgi:hypothetical protein